jgi:AFG3 family protein
MLMLKKAQQRFGATGNEAQYTFTDASYESLKQSIAAQKDIPESQRVPLLTMCNRESLLSNGLVQSVIMIVLFAAVLDVYYAPHEWWRRRWPGWPDL